MTIDHPFRLWDDQNMATNLAAAGIRLGCPVKALSTEALHLLIQWMAHHGEFRWLQHWRLSRRFARWAFGVKFFQQPPQKHVRISAQARPLRFRTRDGTACTISRLARHGQLLKNFAWVSIDPMPGVHAKLDTGRPLGQAVDVAYLDRLALGKPNRCIRERHYHYEDQTVTRLDLFQRATTKVPDGPDWLSRFANKMLPNLKREQIFTAPPLDYYDLRRESVEPVDLCRIMNNATFVGTCRPVQENAEVYMQNDCLFNYCPNPGLCRPQMHCQNPKP